ncbi:TPA: alpha-mannosidase, partial [Escherichia coli]
IISKNNNPSEFRIMATGHAHLDIAWMWPLREGRRKAIRTFATALTNIEKYPDYIFGASQYQLFHWIKKDYPYFFEKLKKQIAAGRFELQGCFWVECDLNLVSGESLIRQIMHGTRFTLQNFSKKINYVWQPDVFGFPATLPQILKKSGINYIASQKLSQNKINKFNNYLFRWQGLDGSEILMHNFPEDTYDSRARARSLEYIEQNYNEKEICPYALMVYGVGDGGAGPGEEHIERLTRIRNIDGLPHVDFSRVDKFFTHADAFRESLPIISGELYFEAHQGCFTSESATKAHNRIMENKLHDAEFFITITNNMTSILRSEFDEIWKAMLTLQFHDILPGSCISRVYHETEKEYLKLEAKTEKI